MFPVGKNSYLVPSLDVRPSDAVVVFQSELDYLSRCILDYPNIETGGQLFGYWTSTGVPVVLYVLGPGENANHQYAFFNQDLEYLERVGRWLTGDFGLQHIGEWHSHHHLGLARPSFHDTKTFLECMRGSDLPRFLMCIGNCTETTSTINAFNYVAGSPNYREARWEVMPMESPFRKEIDWRLEGYLLHPQTQHAVMDGMKYRRPRGVSYPQGYWMNDTKNNMELKQILEFLQSKSEGLHCVVSLDEQGLVHIQSKDRRQNVLQDVVFPMGFPIRFPIVTDEIKGICATGEGWDPEGGNLAQAFEEYYNLHEI